MMEIPSRVVCLSNETVDMLIRLGCAGNIAGVSAESRHGETAGAENVGGFNSPRLDVIMRLKPDIVICWSESGMPVISALRQRGLRVVVLNHFDMEGIQASILDLGRLMGRNDKALELVAGMRSEMDRIACRAKGRKKGRPKVYFEEWDRPHITCAAWVSDMIELAGGINVFSNLSRRRFYLDRVVYTDEVVSADPDLIIASWCGRPVDKSMVSRRSGWAEISAVRSGRIHELSGELVLQPGPRVIEGIQAMSDIFCS